MMLGIIYHESLIPCVSIKSNKSVALITTGCLVDLQRGVEENLKRRIWHPWVF